MHPPHQKRTCTQPLPVPEKNIRNASLEAIVKEIKERKEKRQESQESQGGGANVQKKRSISYGLTKQVLEKHKQANPWLSKDVLENYNDPKPRKRQQDS